MANVRKCGCGMIKVELKGFKELEETLRLLPDRVEKRVLQSAVTSAVRIARREIKKSAPVGQEASSVQKKYGYKKLKQSLKVKRLRRVEGSERAARVDTGTAFWATFYEKGTRNQPARPFFKPAFERSKNEMLKKLAERLDAGITKEVKKLKR